LVLGSALPRPPKRENPLSTTGFYSGSFDPPTNGHMDVIARALRLVDRLVVGVGVHPQKAPFLDASERVRLLQSEAARIPGATDGRVSVVTFDALAVDAARSNGARVIIRGLRNPSDFDYERQMGSMNASMAPDIETVYLAASPSVSFISSTLVRQIAAMGGDITAFVPQEVVAAVASRRTA
jgi:pantetheine-phosphate adenylyltransferase